MSQIIELKVPDIGDFTDVPVIEVFVKPGDVIKVDDALVSAEIHPQTGVGIHIQGAAIGQVQGARAFGVGGHLGVIKLARRTDMAGQHRTHQGSGDREGRAPG